MSSRRAGPAAVAPGSAAWLRRELSRLNPGRSAEVLRMTKVEMEELHSRGGKLNGGAPQVQAAPQQVPAASGGSLDDAIRSIVRSEVAQLPSALDEERVRELVAECGAVRVELAYGERTASITSGHKLTALLTAIVSRNVPCYMVGPAGTGKSTAAETVATALGLELRSISVNVLSSKSDLLGSHDAHGNYRSTGFRDAYEHGKLFLLDEADAANPAILTVLNAAIANGHMEFPDGRIVRHEDFRLLAAGNTYGLGADLNYTGRERLDAATLDRFFFLHWGVDTNLARAACGLPARTEQVLPESSGFGAEQWVDAVLELVRPAEKQRHVLSPRAAIYGVRLLDIVPAPYLVHGLVTRGLNDTAAAQLVSGTTLQSAQYDYSAMRSAA